MNAAAQATIPRPSARPAHVLALLGGNAALALGPWSVRLADCGPVAAGFWRLFLALPLLAVLALANRQRLTGFPKAAWAAMAGAGIFFGLDLAAWHIGIGMTRLGNVTLFGNAGSLILVAWGLIVLRRLPRRNETLAFAAAIGGSAILLGRSLQVGTDTLHGDLFCLLAGFFYTFYILLLQNARATLGNWSLLFWSSAAGAPVLLAIAIALGETIVPTNWWPLIALSLLSQVIGQGLLVYSLRHFSPLIIGLALLTQPAIAVLAGWFAFGETLGWLDAIGMVMVAGALVIAQARGPREA
jgi:drug/metabolite transporter (DMT)-like permease